jgi:hypothetical protein
MNSISYFQVLCDLNTIANKMENKGTTLSKGECALREARGTRASPHPIM